MTIDNFFYQNGVGKVTIETRYRTCYFFMKTFQNRPQPLRCVILENFMDFKKLFSNSFLCGQNMGVVVGFKIPYGHYTKHAGSLPHPVDTKIKFPDISFYKFYYLLFGETRRTFQHVFLIGLLQCQLITNLYLACCALKLGTHVGII